MVSPYIVFKQIVTLDLTGRALQGPDFKSTLGIDQVTNVQSYPGMGCRQFDPSGGGEEKENIFFSRPIPHSLSDPTQTRFPQSSSSTHFCLRSVKKGENVVCGRSYFVCSLGRSHCLHLKTYRSR